MTTLKLPDGSTIKLSQWLTKILLTKAPGEITLDNADPDHEWLIVAVDCPTPIHSEISRDVYPKLWSDSQRPAELRGRIQLRMKHSLVPCYDGDTYNLALAHERFNLRADEHKVPKLAALWTHFEEVLRAEVEAPLIYAEVIAFSQALNAAAEAWGSYTRQVVGTMSMNVVVRAGMTLVIDRIGQNNEPIKDAGDIPVTLYILEKRGVQ